MAYASSLSHLLLFPLLFFYPYSSSVIHCSSHAGIATPVFYQACMAAPLTLILRSKYQGTIHWPAWGRWQKSLCFPSVCMREKEKVERKSTRYNKWRVRDDRACDPVFFHSEIFFCAGFSVLSVWLQDALRRVWHEPHLFVSLPVAMVMALLTVPVICLLIHPGCRTMSGCFASVDHLDFPSPPLSHRFHLKILHAPANCTIITSNDTKHTLKHYIIKIRFPGGNK